MPRMYFDRSDNDILQLVNRVLRASSTADLLANPDLHPHGIKELVDTPAARMAYAVVNLLHNLETTRSQAKDRLLGLRVLYDEVINSAHTTLRRNTARVLMQIMKGMVRAYGNEEQQLKLAHDFRAAAQGTPRVVRRLLRRYHLPEMPEEWNQMAFDDHVYDMSTKGRKSPTHLIMDAWIKGLRHLTVVYDNCVDLEAVSEVLAAGAIVGITVRIGIEFRVPFRNRFVTFVWIPRGFLSDRDFLDFLSSSKMAKITAEGRNVVSFTRDQVLKDLHIWNETLRPDYARCYGLVIPPVGEDDFLNYLGRGHANKERLAEYLNTLLSPQVEERLEELSLKNPLTEEEEQQLALLKRLCSDTIQADWLSCAMHEELPRIELPRDLKRLPKLMTLSPRELVRELHTISSCRIVLCTSGLSVEDVLELLWDCKGAITHLELFSMRAFVSGKQDNVHEIGELRFALNSGQAPRLKQMIRQMIRSMREAGDERRAEKFEKILIGVPVLWERYRNLPLKSRIGTGSGNRSRAFGMGFVVTDTLPRRSARYLEEIEAGKPRVPIRAEVEKHTIFREPENLGPMDVLLQSMHGLPLCANLGLERTDIWASPVGTMRESRAGNIVNLLGPITPSPLEEKKEEGTSPGRFYLNNGLVNIMKVLVGFIPAFWSFMYTQEWWFLACFGAFIWFGITGVRNVVQMVLAAKGLSRNNLLHWRDHVSLNRLCDSLMYTGISVFLLEFLMRDLLFERTLGISVMDNPMLIFAALNVVNGFYIFAHNIYRGFPRAAAVGNLFRAILAIPVAALYNSVFAQILILCGVTDIAFYLAPLASVISKCASDSVAALIEGLADSRVNIRMRRTDYANKLRSVFDTYTMLELLFPKEDVFFSLARPGGLKGRGGTEARRLELTFIVNALDMMYIWYYQPRAQEALRMTIRSLTGADRMVVLLSQLVLLREREVSQLMVDGLVGRDFARPLAFYLSKRKAYLRDMVQLCRPARVTDPETAASVAEVESLLQQEN